MPHHHSHSHDAVPASLVKYAWLSVVAAVITMAIKAAAAAATGSVALLSDALESSVNLVAGLVAVVAVRIAERPPDDSHPHGHTKVEYFAAAFEGLMVLAAAVAVAVAAVSRLANPQPLEQVPLGLAATIVAGAVNLAVALIVLRAGRTHRSIALEADAKHLLADVWTSVGVLVGVALAAATGVWWLDPVAALAVAVNVVIAGWALVNRSAHGLMDAAIAPEAVDTIRAVLDSHIDDDGSGLATYEHLRTRQAGRESFMSVDLLVPAEWTVLRAHELADVIEAELRVAVPGLQVVTHVEPASVPIPPTTSS